MKGLGIVRISSSLLLAIPDSGKNDEKLLIMDVTTEVVIPFLGVTWEAAMGKWDLLVLSAWLWIASAEIAWIRCL